MSKILVCDKCGEQIDTNGPLSARSWLQARVALDESVNQAGVTKDYHLACGHALTLADVWERSGLVPLAQIGAQS